MKWEEISIKLDKKIKVGTEIPKTDGRTRPVTKITEDRIYMRTGVETEAKKSITKDMLKYACEIIISGATFNSNGLKSRFPKEYNQGGCVFSMTGGVLEILGIAEYIRGIGYVSVKSLGSITNE